VLGGCTYDASDQQSSIAGASATGIHPGPRIRHLVASSTTSVLARTIVGGDGNELGPASTASDASLSGLLGSVNAPYAT
jgi:hypothetical protein